MNNDIAQLTSLLYFLNEANRKIDSAHDVAMANEWTGTMEDLSNSKSVIAGLIINTEDHLSSETA